MAFTPFTGTYSSGDLQYVINTLYSPKVEREYRANLVAGDFFDDLSGMFAGGGGHLSIPDIFTNQFTAQDKSTGSNVTEQSPAEAELTLTVDTWKEVSYVIEDRQLKQIMAGSDVLDAYASQAKYLIAKALDTSLMALYSGLSQTVNDTASDVTDADVRRAIESVVDGDVPMQRLAFFFHPTVIWYDLFGISKYTGVYDSDPVVTGMLGGGATEARKNAVRGRLYGKTKKAGNAVVKSFLNIKELLTNLLITLEYYVSIPVYETI